MITGGFWKGRTGWLWCQCGWHQQAECSPKPWVVVQADEHFWAKVALGGKVLLNTSPQSHLPFPSSRHHPGLAEDETSPRTNPGSSLTSARNGVYGGERKRGELVETGLLDKICILIQRYEPALWELQVKEGMQMSTIRARAYGCAVTESNSTLFCSMKIIWNELQFLRASWNLGQDSLEWMTAGRPGGGEKNEMAVKAPCPLGIQGRGLQAPCSGLSSLLGSLCIQYFCEPIPLHVSRSLWAVSDTSGRWVGWAGPCRICTLTSCKKVH